MGGGVAVCKMSWVLSLVGWSGSLGTYAYHALETQVTGSGLNARGFQKDRLTKFDLSISVWHELTSQGLTKLVSRSLSSFPADQAYSCLLLTNG